MPDDVRIAAIARNLAGALSDYARERGDDYRKRVAQLQTELCAARRDEIAADAQAAERATTEPPNDTP